MMTFDHQRFLKTVSNQPGIYQMLDVHHTVIYVGKAKNLKKRLTSYFRTPAERHDSKTQALLAHVDDINVIITQHENEALILENNLIKRLQPKYNILLKDHKTYPELWLSDDPFPQLAIHRGPHQSPGQYFGPYPNRETVTQTLTLMQKIFQLRQCDNLFFKNRSRPCLQYQIKRCSAPCVNKIAQSAYLEAVENAKLLLNGHNDQVTEAIKQRMEKASQALDYEQASLYRDQLVQLRKAQQPQSAQVGSQDVDVITAVNNMRLCVVEILMVRGGRIIGHQTFKPEWSQEDALMPPTQAATQALWAFMPQYYLNATKMAASKPRVIYTSVQLPDANWLQNTLKENWEQPIAIRWARQGQAKAWLTIATDNAMDTLRTTMDGNETMQQRLLAIQQRCELPNMPERIVCFDVSHHAGEATRVSCVVSDQKGLLKKAYRIFKVHDITPGDDYAAMQSALAQYFESTTDLPDLILIDGGKGQLSAARETLSRVGHAALPCMGIAKGKARQRGKEQCYLDPQAPPIHYRPDDPGMLWLLHLRDEAHRFAIKAHRRKKRQIRQQSVLETIEGIGKVKRRHLLTHFGGLQALQNATPQEIAQVPGIQMMLAERIHEALQKNRST